MLYECASSKVPFGTLVSYSVAMGLKLVHDICFLDENFCGCS